MVGHVGAHVLLERFGGAWTCWWEFKVSNSMYDEPATQHASEHQYSDPPLVFAKATCSDKFSFYLLVFLLTSSASHFTVY
jgi:hypothetical protein